MTQNGSQGGQTRRRVLLSIGAGAVAALAGCSSGAEGGADNVPVRGDPDADVVLEVYEDLGCPACRQYVQNGLPDIQTQYLDDGLIRYEHRDLITTEIGNNAASAAREVLDRHGNDSFWEFHGAMYANQNRLRSEGAALFGEVASELGFDAQAIQQAGVDRAHQSAVDADVERGRSLGATSTPSFVLDGELIDAGGATINQRVAAVAQQINQALSGE